MKEKESLFERIAEERRGNWPDLKETMRLLVEDLGGQTGEVSFIWRVDPDFDLEWAKSLNTEMDTLGIRLPESVDSYLDGAVGGEDEYKLKCRVAITLELIGLKTPQIKKRNQITKNRALASSRTIFKWVNQIELGSLDLEQLLV